MTDAAVASGTPLPDAAYTDVMRMLPHRYPMLMVDRVTEMRAGESAVGIKNVTFNEPFFPGHFPSDPIMPGVLIVEALGQTAAVLMIATKGEGGGMSVYFSSIDECRFRRPVRPGDQLHLSVKLERTKLGIWWFRGQGIVDGKVCTDALFSARLIER
ncbi:MAG: 3-hydroxyacyl-ACP dehydratase FabZ [Geminicoccaceae bacterium]